MLHIVEKTKNYGAALNTQSRIDALINLGIQEVASRSENKPIEKFLSQHERQLLNGLRTKAAQSPADTNLPLVQATLADFHEQLKHHSALAALGNRIDLGSFRDLILPYRDGTPNDFAAKFRADGDPIRIGKISTSSKKLTPLNWGVIATATNEALAGGQLAQIIKAAMLDDTSLAMDQAAFSTNAGVADTPDGIFAAARRITSSGSSSSDIRNLLSAISNPKKLILVCHPDVRMAMEFMRNTAGSPVWPHLLPNGVVGDVPVITSKGMAANAIGLIDREHFRQIFTIDDFKASETATVVEDDTAPESVDKAAARGQSVRDGFSTNTWALRITGTANWAMTASGRVAIVNGIDLTTWSV